MRRLRIVLPVVSVLAVVLALVASSGSAASPTPASVKTPRWVLHVQRFSGGISNGVRAQAPDATTVHSARVTGRAAGAAASSTGLRNLQMNDDSFPPMPQNETAVDYSRADPLVAVAAANDYVSGGVVVMRTADGGKSWKSTRVTPQFGGTRDFCSGGDPAVAYSRRDHAFYLTQLCFFRALPFSEVQLFKSVDNGKTWTPGRQAARVATNFDYANGTVDESVFHDKEYLTVDNHPGSPHYGRIYVTWTKFHIAADGSSDFCPIQVASTDSVPTTNPLLATFASASVVPDAPGSGGVGESANQFSVPKVEPDGTLDVGYILEECNSSLDHGFRFQKSTDGGASFLASPVHIDKPGQFADNPDPGDLLPPTVFRAPNTLAFAINEHSGAIVFVYTNYLNQATSGGNVTYQVSRDHGLTWSDAKVLSTAAATAPGPPARNDQFFPWIDATPSGDFHAIWFDRRRDPANRNIDTWQATSGNNGRSWETFQISSQSWNPDFGFFTSGAFIGDYNGIAASDKAVYPVWTDGRNSAFNQTGIGETDIFTNVERK
jgi:hypothetical protein